MLTKVEWINETQNAINRIAMRFPDADAIQPVDTEDWLLCQDVLPPTAALIVLLSRSMQRQAKIARDNFITAFNS